MYSTQPVLLVHFNLKTSLLSFALLYTINCNTECNFATWQKSPKQTYTRSTPTSPPAAPTLTPTLLLPVQAKNCPFCSLTLYAVLCTSVHIVKLVLNLYLHSKSTHWGPSAPFSKCAKFTMENIIQSTNTGQRNHKKKNHSLRHSRFVQYRPFLSSLKQLRVLRESSSKILWRLDYGFKSSLSKFCIHFQNLQHKPVLRVWSAPALYGRNDEVGRESMEKSFVNKKEPVLLSS